MRNLIKLTLLLALALVTNNQVLANDKSVSDNISPASAIERSYTQVKKDLAKHIGASVRWRGQVIGSQTLDKITRVTLVSYPLDANRRPSANEATNGMTFVVDFNQENLPKRLTQGNLITVYGTVEGGIKIVNGSIKALIPVLTAQQAKKSGQNTTLTFI